MGWQRAAEAKGSPSRGSVPIRPSPTACVAGRSPTTGCSTRPGRWRSPHRRTAARTAAGHQGAHAQADGPARGCGVTREVAELETPRPGDGRLRPAPRPVAWAGRPVVDHRLNPAPQRCRHRPHGQRSRSIPPCARRRRRAPCSSAACTPPPPVAGSDIHRRRSRRPADHDRSAGDDAGLDHGPQRPDRRVRHHAAVRGDAARGPGPTGDRLVQRSRNVGSR